jgi:hypothetical protein
LPSGRTAHSDIFLLYIARGVRGFGDGFAIIILPAYLSAIGLSPGQIGIVVSASLLAQHCSHSRSVFSRRATTCAISCSAARC